MRVALLTAALLLTRRVGAPAALRRVAVTTAGPVEGVVDAHGARWLNVPFAAPPVGELRFAPPQAPTPWTAVRDCTGSEQAWCPQLVSLLGKLVVGEEDCLYANVYAPPAASASLPVVVFLHGGAYVAGDDKEGGLYDGSRLAANASAVVITANYRLGALGFLTHPSLLSADGAANFGLQDQRHLLRWVHDNAAAFGGDASRVTLMGQSAGAMMVCAHLASPTTNAFFHAAIMESGNCDSALLWSPLPAALQHGLDFAAAHGCDDQSAACLRSLPLAQLMMVQQQDSAPLAPLLPWVPVVDGNPAGVPELPLAALSRTPVPVIVGTVKDEGTMFAVLSAALLTDTPRLDAAQLRDLLLRVYNGSSVSAMLERYPDGTATARLAAIVRDALFVCPARRTAAAIFAGGGRAYMYHFDYVLRWPEARLGLGTYHASELPFVFRNHGGVHTFNGADKRVEVRERTAALQHGCGTLGGWFVSDAPGLSMAGAVLTALGSICSQRRPVGGRASCVAAVRRQQR